MGTKITDLKGCSPWNQHITKAHIETWSIETHTWSPRFTSSPDTGALKMSSSKHPSTTSVRDCVLCVADVVWWWHQHTSLPHTSSQRDIFSDSSTLLIRLSSGERKQLPSILSTSVRQHTVHYTHRLSDSQPPKAFSTGCYFLPSYPNHFRSAPSSHPKWAIARDFIVRNQLHKIQTRNR